MKKLTIEIDFESQSMNVSVNEGTHQSEPRAYADSVFAVRPLNERHTTIIRYEDITWIEAENNRSHIHLCEGGTVTVPQNIGAVYGFLKGSPYADTFFRANRSEVLNIRLLKQYEGNMLKLHDSVRRLTVGDSFRGDYRKILSSIRVLK